MISASELPETDMESDSKLYERVCGELLSGDITNDADVIKVALAQYEERKYSRSKLSESEQKEKVDDSLTITQILDSQIDENGNVIENILTTNLLVLDENQNLVRASAIQSGSAGLNEYSIYATMNVNVTADTSAFTVRFNWFETRLTYGTAMKAGSLIQTSKYAPEPFWEYDDITKQIASPQANVSYRYTPSNKSMIYVGNLGCGRSCRSIVNAGSRSFILAFGVSNNTPYPSGEWTTEYH